MTREAQIRQAAAVVVAAYRGEAFSPEAKAELEALFPTFTAADTAALGAEITRLIAGK